MRGVAAVWTAAEPPRAAVSPGPSPPAGDRPYRSRCGPRRADRAAATAIAHRNEDESARCPRRCRSGSLDGRRCPRARSDSAQCPWTPRGSAAPAASAAAATRSGAVPAPAGHPRPSRVHFARAPSRRPARPARVHRALRDCACERCSGCGGESRRAWPVACAGPPPRICARPGPPHRRARCDCGTTRSPRCRSPGAASGTAAGD